MRSTELVVGEPARRDAGLAIMAALGLAVVFAVVTVVSKETPALDLHQPWQDDPYDVLVSLDFVAVPLLVVIGVMRVLLCRRYEPLPARRLVDLLRVAEAALVVSLATEVAEWVAVALGRHRATWTAATTWQVAALVVLTATLFGGFVLVRGRLVRYLASRLPPNSPTGSPMPSLLACALPGSLGDTVARH